MQGKTVRLESSDGRSLELRSEGRRTTARVGEGEPFDFNFEHLGYVACGMGYQAWGGGSHFAFRHESEGVVVEFQGAKDRGAAVCRLSGERLRTILEDLGANVPTDGRASVL